MNYSRGDTIAARFGRKGLFMVQTAAEMSIRGVKTTRQSTHVCTEAFWGAKRKVFALSGSKRAGVAPFQSSRIRG